MTEANFWFLLGAASISAAVIGWVCFLEVSYRLERRRRRACSIGLAGLKTATHAVVRPPPPVIAVVRTAVPKRKLSIRLPMWSHSKAC